MITLITGVLLVKAHAHDNHRLLSYHDNRFCNKIITLSILLHITIPDHLLSTHLQRYLLGICLLSVMFSGKKSTRYLYPNI